MSRKSILIVLGIIIVALGVWVYFSYHSSTNPGSATNPNTIGSLFPFGTPTAVPAGDSGTGTTGSGTTGTVTPPPETTTPGKLVQVTKKFVAGFTVLPPLATPTQTIDINNPNASQTTTPVLPTVRFAERGTGYIYDTDAKGQNILKSSGTVIAHTLTALFADAGKTVILRYIKNDNSTVATYLGHITPAMDTNSFGETTGSFLPDNIGDLTLATDGKNILFLLPTDMGVAGMTMKTDGTAKKQVFSSSFSEWLLDWPSTGAVVTTKASMNVPGYAYSVSGTGGLNKIIGDINGLTTKVSPDGKNILYSMTKGENMDLHIKQVKSGADVDTGLATLPEKCAWNTAGTLIYCGAGTAVAAGEYPDSWYQGSAHFNDALWKIDAATGITTELNDGEGNYIDALNMTLDQKEQYLFFINKNDASLWSFDLAVPPTTTPASALPSVH